MIKSPKTLKISADWNSFWLDYFLLLSSLLIIWGALVYYIYALNMLGIIITIILTLFSFLRLKKTFLRHGDGKEDEPNKLNLFLILGYLALVFTAFYRFIQAESDRALISPWQVINYDFFWLYALSAFTLCILLTRTKMKSGWKLALISIYYFLSFSAAAIIYKIGYGFDPFVHQATMELIAAKGVVLPKTPYYLGEYGLIITISKISGLAIQTLSRFLVPFLAAVFIPTALFDFLKRQTKQSSAIFLAIVFILLLGFSPFIATTPQNLSYLFLIMAVFSAAASDNLARVLILSLAAAAIHPLSGLPAIALTAFVIFKKYKKAIWLFTALSIPFALFLSSGASLKNIGGGKIFIASLHNLFGSINGAGREDVISNFVYLIANNYHLIIILVIIAALWRIKRIKDVSEYFKSTNGGLILISSALLAAYFLSGQIIFDNVISYEQSGYADRIPVIILIFLAPSIIIALKDLIGRILEQKTALRILWLIFGISVLSASLYISYPRFDKYFNSRGYSTSANDIAAVRSIDSEARSPYIVLANQQVSAAALQAFGFNHYYQTSAGELYFYPIPTGSPLYQYYLDMVYKNPSRETMDGALNLFGTDTGYLVINKYWYQSGRVINEAKLTADRWWTINNEVYIFKYRR